MNITSTLRSTAQNIIDELQFKFDVYPRLQYQPLPWIGLKRARRGHGTVARWKAIESSLDGLAIGSAADIGCSVGYFCIALALKGIPVLGIDMDARSLRIAQYASRKLGTRNAGFSNMLVSPATASLLPNADLIVLTSVWHHWILHYGFDGAGQIMSTVWERCGKVLIFETGEQEMPAEFDLPPMDPSPKVWLENYLASVCPGSTITHLGRFRAFGPGGDEKLYVAERNLFKVARLSLDGEHRSDQARSARRSDLRVDTGTSAT
ncbi:MAG TPA: class I SAM-dependent methyltransferase [Chloroflexota bacterium]|nr:class I SAM-dependent methyltransferase [Chloroflexota bacterium]